MSILSSPALQVHFVKLHFLIQTTESRQWPVNKVSALRGGMGEALLRLHCVRDRRCEACSFREDCLVQRMMYSHMKIQPTFMSRGDSMGYVLECTDYRNYLEKGEELEFHLLLIGSNIACFNLYLQAFQYLGMMGIGKEHARYEILRVTDSTRRTILRNRELCMADFPVQTLQQYLEHRKQEQSYMLRTSQLRILLRTPLCLKYRGAFLSKLVPEALMESASRRLYMLDCFEGIPADAFPAAEHLPKIAHQKITMQAVKRFSTTHNDKINLTGMTGSVDLTDVDEAAQELLLIGELLHLGKNTSFGFGQYVITS